MNNLLKEAEDELVAAVNPFSKLRDVWDGYAAMISMFLSIQYAIIMLMLCAVCMKYEVSEFYWILLFAVLMDLYGVADRKRIRRIYQPRSIEIKLTMKKTSNIHHGVSAQS